MFVKVLSTRHTAVGTFRLGVVYEVDEKNQGTRKHVLPLLEGKKPPLQKISQKQAQDEKATPRQFTPEVTAPDAKAAATDLRQALGTAQKAQKEAEEQADAAQDEAAALKTELEQLRAEHEAALAKLAAQNEGSS